MGMHLLVVAVGTWLNELEINSIASYPSRSNVLRVRDLSSVGAIRGVLKDAVCNGEDDADNSASGHVVFTKRVFTNLRMTGERCICKIFICQRLSHS